LNVARDRLCVCVAAAAGCCVEADRRVQEL
jgi:hypothetical protein